MPSPARRPSPGAPRVAALLAATAALLAAGCGSPILGPARQPATRTSEHVGVVVERPLVSENGGRLDWCHLNDRIAFERSTRSGVSEVYTIDPHGREEHCLTCNVAGLPKGLRGHPSWHPSCRWLVIQVANRYNRNGRYEQLSWGIHQDLWAVAADGSWAEPLVTTGQLGAALAPRVARDGSRLVWSVRVPTGRRIVQKTGHRTPGAEDPWDGWHLAVAKIETGAGGRPRLGPPTALFQGAAGGGFYEADALVGDTLWFSHSPRGDPYVDDVYRVSLSGGAPENLTRSPGVWDEGAKPSPGGQLVAWVSSAGNDWHHPPDLENKLRLELFVVDRRGRSSRISGLNDVLLNDQSGARAVAGEHAWGPDGREIALAYAVFSPDAALSERIEVIELDGPH